MWIFACSNTLVCTHSHALISPALAAGRPSDADRESGGKGGKEGKERNKQREKGAEAGAGKKDEEFRIPCEAKVCAACLPSKALIKRVQEHVRTDLTGCACIYPWR